MSNNLDYIEVDETENKSAIKFGKRGLKQTGIYLTKMLDNAEKVDRWFQLHGEKYNWFVGLSAMVVIIAPIIDWLRGDWKDTLTYWSTAILFVFIIIISVAWIASLRDNEGDWSIRRVWDRIFLYLQISWDFIADCISKPKEEIFYRISIILITSSFFCKALQSVSFFFRKTLYVEHTLGKISLLRSFEKISNTWALFVFIIGIILLAYVCYTNKNIWDGFLKKYSSHFTPTENKNSDINGAILNVDQLVIDTKNQDQIGLVLQQHNSELFKDFVLAIQKWNPRECYSEDDFENKLHRHLKRNISNSSVQRQYRIIVDPNDARKDNKADIVVNETILIEMKKDVISASSKYVFDQVYRYSELWKNKGPVILLFCEANYDKVKTEFVPKLTLLGKDNKKVIAFVAKPIP